MRGTTQGILLVLAAVVAFGCGPYRVTYLKSQARAETLPKSSYTHAHGIGPLLIGGGGYFFLLNPMSPALIDYTGAVAASERCPGGFGKVEHYHTFGQNAAAAFISWLAVVNAYHESNEDWYCLRPDRSADLR